MRPRLRARSWGCCRNSCADGISAPRASVSRSQAAASTRARRPAVSEYLMNREATKKPAREPAFFCFADPARLLLGAVLRSFGGGCSRSSFLSRSGSSGSFLSRSGRSGGSGSCRSSGGGFGLRCFGRLAAGGNGEGEQGSNEERLFHVRYPSFGARWMTSYNRPGRNAYPTGEPRRILACDAGVPIVSLCNAIRKNDNSNAKWCADGAGFRGYPGCFELRGEMGLCI